MGATLLAVGDSITRGTGASVLSNAYIYQTRKLLQANGKPCYLIDAGIGGIRSDELLAKYKGNGGRCDPDIVTIMIGTNDVSQSVSTATYQTNLQNIINDVKNHKSVGQCQIVLMTLIFRTDTFYAQNPSFNTVINTVASTNNIPVVDMSTVISSSADMFDAYHPNDSGHLKIANALYTALSALSVWNNIPKR